jgi:hypothetical protein
MTNGAASHRSSSWAARIGVMVFSVSAGLVSAALVVTRVLVRGVLDLAKKQYRRGGSAS